MALRRVDDYLVGRDTGWCLGTQGDVECKFLFKVCPHHSASITLERLVFDWLNPLSSWGHYL